MSQSDAGFARDSSSGLRGPALNGVPLVALFGGSLFRPGRARGPNNATGGSLGHRRWEHHAQRRAYDGGRSRASSTERGTSVRRRVPGSLFVRRKGAWHCTGRATKASCSGTRSGRLKTEPDAPIAVARECPPKHCLVPTVERTARFSCQTMIWDGTSVRGQLHNLSTERATSTAMGAMQLGRSPATAHHNSSDELYCQRSPSHTSNSSACMTLTTRSRGTSAFMAMAEA